MGRLLEIKTRRYSGMRYLVNIAHLYAKVKLKTLYFKAILKDSLRSHDHKDP
jgi:hypothetical protein